MPTLSRTQMQLQDHERTIGRAAVAAAVLGTLLAPVHALSRYATEDGKEDLELTGVRTWAEPARDILSPLLEWSDADTVYLTWGKLWLPIVAAAVLCALAVRRGRTPRTGERWAWRVALTGYVLLLLQLFGSYWTPYLDQSFLLLGVPGMLLSLLGSTVLGVALLRGGFRPTSTSVLLALWVPTLIVLSHLFALGAAMMPMIWAWGSAGRRLLTDTEDAGTAAQPLAA